MSRTLTFGAALVSALLLGSGVAVADDAPAPSDPTSGPTSTPTVEPSEPPAEPGPKRILLTGDSITQGFHGDYTWRYRLAKEFTRQQVPVDFVGSRTLPYLSDGRPGARYADPNFDQDHFAFAGTTLLQQSGWIAEEVRQQKPDLVVVASGVNDMRHGSTPAQTIDHFRGWVQAIRSADPDIDIIVSPVLASTDTKRPTLASSITAYDALLPGVIAELTTADSPLTLADTTFGWDVQKFTIENLHPNPTGETHIAQRIAETLHLQKVLPQTPVIYRAERWTRTEQATVTVKNNVATLTWPDLVISGAKIYTHRIGGNSSISKAAYRGGTHPVGNLKYGSTYEFRLQLTRGRLVGPWGPTTRVKIPKAVRPAAVARVVVNAGGVRWTASPRATSYLVQTQVKKNRKLRWSTARRTTGLRLLARNVYAAKVTAVNAAGKSAVRAGRR